MTKEEKLEGLKKWLKENGVKFRENYTSRTYGVFMDLRTCKLRVAVRLARSEEENLEFVKKVYILYSPFFIRDEESMEFIIEKMRNCLQMTKEKKERCREKRLLKEERKKAHELAKQEADRRRLEKEQKKEEKPKKKRARIVKYAKVEI